MRQRTGPVTRECNGVFTLKKLKESRSRREGLPKDLSRAAKEWFSRLTTEFEIEDQAGLLLLETAMRAYDRAETARALLERDGVTIADRWGQVKPHPAAAIERDARSGLLAALKALNLDVEPLRDRPGRPPANARR